MLMCKQTQPVYLNLKSELYEPRFAPRELPEVDEAAAPPNVPEEHSAVLNVLNIKNISHIV